MDGIVQGSLLGLQVRRSCRPLLAVMIAVAFAGHIRAGERTPARLPKVDPAVMQAGGMASGQARCSQCQRSACPQCRLADAHHHGHSQCQHGLCPAHCPVRPDVFGFYGTRWRRWPGSGVAQASNNEAATPARPPRAEVPAVEEESLQPDPAAEDLPAPAAEELPAETEAAKPAAKPQQAVDPQSSVQPARDSEAIDDNRRDETRDEDVSGVQPVAAAREEREEVASPTAWRTFTSSPPRLAARR